MRWFDRLKEKADETLDDITKRVSEVVAEAREKYDKEKRNGIEFTDRKVVNGTAQYGDIVVVMGDQMEAFLVIGDEFTIKEDDSYRDCYIVKDSICLTRAIEIGRPDYRTAVLFSDIHGGVIFVGTSNRFHCGNERRAAVLCSFKPSKKGEKR